MEQPQATYSKRMSEKMHLKMMYAEYMSTILQDDKDCSKYLPINVQDDSVFESL